MPHLRNARKGLEGRGAPGSEYGRGSVEGVKATLDRPSSFQLGPLVQTSAYEQFLQTRPLPAAMACSTEPEMMVWERFSDGQSGVVWYTPPPGVQ